VPDHVVLYRGFQDSFDLRGRVVYETKQFRVGGTLRLETSAVPASHVNAAAIDGTKLEPSLAARNENLAADPHERGLRFHLDVPRRHRHFGFRSHGRLQCAPAPVEI
jgi:hypothetical protein